MAKHRKTRQEKMVADQRHVVYHLEPSTAQVYTPSEKKSASSHVLSGIAPRKPVAVSYAYVKSDLRKTTLVTSAMIISQIVLFLFLNRI